MAEPYRNPFSTRYVRPSALTYLFPPGEDASLLVQRLRRSGWWGQVIGPHGAGKTTLLYTLRRVLQQAGRELQWVTLQNGQKRLPPATRAGRNDWNSQVLVVVDGYEQLGWYARWQLKSRCRRTGAGLLVTSHKNVGLPLIYHIEPALPVVLELAARLLAEWPGVLRDEEVAHHFHAWNGNVRETFFALYDLYERRCRELERTLPAGTPTARVPAARHGAAS